MEIVPTTGQILYCQIPENINFIFLAGQRITQEGIRDYTILQDISSRNFSCIYHTYGLISSAEHNYRSLVSSRFQHTFRQHGNTFHKSKHNKEFTYLPVTDVPQCCFGYQADSLSFRASQPKSLYAEQPCPEWKSRKPGEFCRYNIFKFRT